MKKLQFEGFTSFHLKIFAMATMVIDHMGYVLFPQARWMRYIGRVAFPLFAFMVAEGYLHTRNAWKYLGRLLIFAVISQVPFALMSRLPASSLKRLNVYFTLSLGLLAIITFEKVREFLRFRNCPPLPSFIIACLPPALCMWLGSALNVDYAWRGVALIFAFHFAKTNWQAIACVLGLFAVYQLPQLMVGRWEPNKIGLFFSLPLLYLYNGKKGGSMRYLFYIIYPAHMLILVLIRNIIR